MLPRPSPTTPHAVSHAVSHAVALPSGLPPRRQVPAGEARPDAWKNKKAVGGGKGGSKGLRKAVRSEPSREAWVQCHVQQVPRGSTGEVRPQGHSTRTAAVKAGASKGAKETVRHVRLTFWPGWAWWLGGLGAWLGVWLGAWLGKQHNSDGGA